MAMNSNESSVEGYCEGFFFSFCEFLHLNCTVLFTYFVHMAKSQQRVITVSFMPSACFSKSTAGGVRLDLYCFVTGAKRV